MLRPGPLLWGRSLGYSRKVLAEFPVGIHLAGDFIPPSAPQANQELADAFHPSQMGGPVYMVERNRIHPVGQERVVSPMARLLVRKPLERLPVWEYDWFHEEPPVSSVFINPFSVK